VVTVPKALSIVAPTGVYAGISVFSATDGVTVNAPGATVVLRGLSINGQGGRWGVNVQAAARVRIENCVVANMVDNGINDTANGAELIVVDTIVRDNGGFGVSVAADAAVLLNRVQAVHNQGSGLGVVASSSEVTATVTNSLFSGNAGHGIIADSAIGTTTHLAVERSVASKNGGTGIWAQSVHTGSQLVASFVRNVLHRNVGDGIFVYGTNAHGYASENALEGNQGAGIHASGHVYTSLSGNTAQSIPLTSAFQCDGDGAIQMFSLGNNNVDSVSPTDNCSWPRRATTCASRCTRWDSSPRRSPPRRATRG